MSIDHGHPAPTASTGFDGQDLRTLIDDQASRWADKPFLIWCPLSGPDQTWTYAEFASLVRRFAGGLAERGLKPGDRLMVHLDNCPESLICWLGCAYAGVVAVTTNAKASDDDLAYYARHSRAVGAVTQPQFAARLASAAPGLAWIASTATDGGERPSLDIPAGVLPFETLYGDPASLPARPLDPMAPFAIQYTSGTTARPKAVLWTHANGLFGARMSAMHEGLKPDDVHLVTLPLYHTNAQVYSVLASLEVGATVVLQPRFSASQFWPVSQRHGCTWASMVPFCLGALASQPVPADHRYRMWGNAICAPPSDRLFGIKTIGWWGMTETVTHGTVGSPYRDNTPMSVGRPSPAFEIHVLNEDGSPTQPGETGELFVRGRRGVSLFLEYAGDPEATAKAFREDGLFITGDRIRIGPDGAFFFADRSKDMLKVGGENVAASEVEQAILAVPGVSEAAVVGKRHPMLDEVPVAFVIAKPDADPDVAARIAAECERRLASFKRPREVRLVESLPRATLNKVAKAELRKLLAPPE